MFFRRSQIARFLTITIARDVFSTLYDTRVFSNLRSLLARSSPHEYGVRISAYKQRPVTLKSSYHRVLYYIVFLSSHAAAAG